MRNNFKELQEIIGYTFNEERLLSNALTHSSYANENGYSRTEMNERLEFLGDAVLELVVSEHIFRAHTSMPEGEMTKLRASLVCEESLSYHAKRLRLGDFLLLGKGERATGGAARSSLLADAFEALLGAVFLDGGMDKARECALSILTDDTEGKGEKIDYKTDLQEIIQRTSKEPITYAIVSETGPDHDKKFTSSVSHAGEVIGEGKGKTKKESEQMAARMALEKLKNIEEEKTNESGH